MVVRSGQEPASQAWNGAMAATQNYSLRLDTDRRSQLEAIARRKDRDLSYVIRKAIDERWPTAR